MPKREYHLFEEWDEDTPISWRNAGRKRLNVVVRMANAWQLEQDFDHEESFKVLAHIDLGKRSWATVDGGGGWLEVLEEIEAFIKAEEKG